MAGTVAQDTWGCGPGYAAVYGACLAGIAVVAGGWFGLARHCDVPANMALVRQHDRFNICLLPWFGVLAGWAAVYGDAAGAQEFVMYGMLAYVCADTAWIAARPSAVASKPRLILAHHFVTLLLLAGGLENAQYRLGCATISVEFNTGMLLLSRERALPPLARRLVQVAFWASTLLIRFGVHPWATYTTMVRPLLCPGALFCRAGLVLLCAFNVYFLLIRVVAVPKASAGGGHTVT